MVLGPEISSVAPIVGVENTAYTVTIDTWHFVQEEADLACSVTRGTQESTDSGISWTHVYWIGI